MSWEVLEKIVVLVEKLAEKHPGKLPHSDVLSLRNALESRNVLQACEHLLWIARAILHHGLHEEDEDARRVLELVSQLPTHFF
jgi:hypothetical protein